MSSGKSPEEVGEGDLGGIYKDDQRRTDPSRSEVSDMKGPASGRLQVRWSWVGGGDGRRTRERLRRQKGFVMTGEVWEGFTWDGSELWGIGEAGRISGWCRLCLVEEDDMMGSVWSVREGSGRLAEVIEGEDGCLWMGIEGGRV